jgi:transposase
MTEKYTYELNKIQKSLKSTKDPVIRERLLMVQASLKEPLREVAKDFTCVHGKVAYWKNRYLKHGLRGLQTKQRSGAPKKLTKEQETKLKRKVRKHDVKKGWNTKRIRKLIYEDTGIKYSVRQVQRISHSWGLSQIKPRPRYAYSKKDDREAFIKKTRVG